MGQRFSDLKGIFGTMEQNRAIIGRSSIDSEFVTSSSCLEASDVEKKPDTGRVNDNGNGDLNQHFESIYSNTSDIPSSLNTSNDELNGNVVSEQMLGLHSPVQCLCKENACSGTIKKRHNFCASKKKSSDSTSCNNFKRNTNRTLSLTTSGNKRSRSKTHRGKDVSWNSVKKRNHWVLKFNCAKLKNNISGSSSSSIESDIPETNVVCESCICTGYKRTDEHHLGAGVIFETSLSGCNQSPNLRKEPSPSSSSASGAESTVMQDPSVTTPAIDLSKFNPDDFPIEDCDERARLERAREIAEGVEPPPGFQPGQHIQLVYPQDLTLDSLAMLFQRHLGLQTAALTALSQIDISLAPSLQRIVHTQVDYIHCLVPDLLQITSCSFYWGKMDRYEAERLLEGRPEGTFLLRDSAQEEYLFSVSFRKYGRSLHARIEQWNHRFSFDSHDPGVFASPTVCGLIEHYKDPSCCMFFEPMLTIPLHRNFPFPLQHLCRATVCSRASYDAINHLLLPKAMKIYLKEYHYKQRVRVRRFDTEL